MMFSSAVLAMAPLAFAIDSEDIVPNLTFFALLVAALAIHEFGHAWTALKLGDDTAQRLGRVTLNPLPHLDLVFSVILPLYLLFTNAGFLFGAGKPVPVDHRKLRRPAFDLMVISAAGPFMNVVLAFALILGFHAAVGVKGVDAIYLSREPLYNILFVGIRLNFVLAILNMMPVPPLDGHRVLAFFLPEPVRERFYRMSFLGLIFIVYLLFGGGDAHLQKYVLRPISDLLVPLMPGQLSIF